MGFLSSIIGGKTSKNRVGKFKFSNFKAHSEGSFEESIKNLKSHHDRDKAKFLDKELRKKEVGYISQKKYLEAAGKTYGHAFKRRFKKQALTHYGMPSLLTGVRKKMNIYYTQKERHEAGESKSEKSKFANQIDPAKVQTTAGRLGARSGKVLHRPSKRNVDRPVLKI